MRSSGLAAFLLLTVATGGCGGDPAQNAPLECLRKAKRDQRLDLADDYLVQLCSGATNADARIECYVAAKRDPALALNTNGALLLCSPFNLDAYNARRKDCPSVDTGDIESRLRHIERHLDDLADHR